MRFDYFDEFLKLIKNKDKFDLKSLRSFYDYNFSKLAKGQDTNRFLDYCNSTYYDIFEGSEDETYFVPIYNSPFIEPKPGYKPVECVNIKDTKIAAVFYEDTIRIMLVKNKKIIIEEFGYNEFKTYFFDEDISDVLCGTDIEDYLDIHTIMEKLYNSYILPDIMYSLREEKNGFVFEKHTLGYDEISILSSDDLKNRSIYSAYKNKCNIEDEIINHKKKMKNLL